MLEGGSDGRGSRVLMFEGMVTNIELKTSSEKRGALLAISGGDNAAGEVFAQ